MKELGFQFIGRLPKWPKFKAPVLPDFDASEHFAKILPDLTHWRQSAPNLKASYSSLDRYRHDKPQLNAIAWNKAKEAMHDMYYPIMGNSTVMSTEEVIPYMDAKTSPGYPFTLLGTTKREVIDQPGIFEQCDAHLAELARGESTPIFTQSTKAELRKVSKIEKNDLRGFTGAPLDFLTTQMRLFFDMNEKLYRSDGSTWSEAGTTFQSGGWHKMAMKLLAVSDLHHEIDGKAYDGSLFEQGFRAIADFRIECLSARSRSSVNIQAIQNCYMWIVHTPIVMPDGMLFKKNSGGPSGQFNTLVDNVLFMRLLLAYVYFLKNPTLTIESLDEHTTAINMGDDVVLTISPELRDHLTMKDIQDVGKEIGMVFEMPRGLHGATLDKIEFCSSTFTYDPSLRRWAAKASGEKIISSLIFPKRALDAPMVYSRACMQRINAYVDREVYEQVESFLDSLEEKYRPYLKSKEWRNALKNRWSERRVRMHIYGLE